MRKYLLMVAAAGLACIPMRAGTVGFVLGLDPGADLSAAPGGLISWNLRIENDDPSLFLSIDTVNWTAVLNSSQGTDDGFASFLFPLVGPSSTESDMLFSITWKPGATPGYSTGNTFVISSSFCADSSYHGCVSNSDVDLDFVASVSQPAGGAAAPEPVSWALVGLGLLLATPWRTRR